MLAVRAPSSPVLPTHGHVFCALHVPPFAQVPQFATLRA
jgi:hypothetical protein